MPSQFAHAAPQWAFQLWVWSFIFIFILGLFNILLGLLIEGYMRAGEERNETKTVAEDLSIITQEQMNRMFMPSKLYLSDHKLKAYLSARKAGLPSSNALKNVIITHLDGEIDRSKSISLPAGIIFSFEEMSGLIEKTEGANVSSYALIRRPPPTPDDQQAAMLPDSDVIHSITQLAVQDKKVMDLIHRFSDDSVSEPEGESEDDRDQLLKIFSLEILLRKLVMFAGHGILMNKVAAIGSVLVQMAKKMLPPSEYLNFVKKLQVEDESSNTVKGTQVGRLTVTIVGAEYLPHLDLFSPPDAYCVLFLVPQSVEKVGFGCNASRTKIEKNKNCPVWMETFQFDVDEKDEYFVISLFDSDSSTNDQLIGCVVIRFHQLRDGEAVDTWFDIELSRNIINRSTKRPRIHLQMQFTKRHAGPNNASGEGGWAAK